jgi:hypothetical protein
MHIVFMMRGCTPRENSAAWGLKDTYEQREKTIRHSGMTSIQQTGESSQEMMNLNGIVEFVIGRDGL